MIKSAEDLSNLPLYLTYDDVLLLPNHSEVTPSKAMVKTKLTEKVDLDMPIIASPMDTVCEGEMAAGMARLGGLGIIHRNLTIEEQVSQLKQVMAQDLLVAAAVGEGSDLEERSQALVEAGAEILCIDSGHGNSQHVVKITSELKQKYPQVELVSGNVATYEGAKRLFEAGADVIRTGMGPGSICTTRVVSAMGVPQLTAVVECVRAAREMNRHVIADGGIRTSGDIVKALAAGASTVMLGSMLAKTDKAPGEVIEIEGKKYKNYRGMGSISAMKKGSAARYGQEARAGDDKKLVPEGIEALVEYKGTLSDEIHQLVGGLKSGMSYFGAETLSELVEKARFIRISRASLVESKPHSVVEIKI
jgi:IMP dehydrogenase